MKFSREFGDTISAFFDSDVYDEQAFAAFMSEPANVNLKREFLLELDEVIGRNLMTPQDYEYLTQIRPVDSEDLKGRLMEIRALAGKL